MVFFSSKVKIKCISRVLLPSLLLFFYIATADTYTIAAQHKSLLVAVGCFWCGEETFEHYAPGVVEAVSGYAGGTTSNPTYQNHGSAGHLEVVLVEYDPSKTSYGLLLDYAWRNIDPFNGRGQFCDWGSSYKPAIFFDGEEERLEAERVQAEVLEANPSWKEVDIKVSLLERPKFWKAEDYHQNYYIKNPRNYGYYKSRCGRVSRLKEVWGEDEYDCYHDLELTCFDAVRNSNGTAVSSEVNSKNVPEGEEFLMPTYAVILLVIGPACLCIGSILFIIFHKTKNTNKR